MLCVVAGDITRASFKKLSPIVVPQLIPPPDRIWSTDEWTAIRRGFRSRSMDDRWHAYAVHDRLYLHRSWTGYGVFEAQFLAAGAEWRISEAVVEGDATTYRRGNDAYESLHLLWVVGLVLLGEANDDLWREMQAHR